MAGRTSVGIGWGVAFTIISVISLGLFVTTVVFYAQKQNATKKFNELQTSMNEFVKDAERERDDIKQLRNAAGKKNQSLVTYLIANQEQTMTLAGGAPRTSVEDFQKSVEIATGGKTLNLLQAVRDRDSTLGLERDAKAKANDAKNAAEARLQTVQSEATAKENGNKIALDEQIELLKKYKAEVDANAKKVKDATDAMTDHEARIQREADEKVKDRDDRISNLEKEQLLSRDTISRLQSELKGRSLKPGDEHALVDAEVIGLDAAENNVFLNIGTNKKARVGLTFEVYSEPTALRPDPATGNYPAGKASLEIIKVDATSSTARVIREKKGNPVLKGDVVANAVYDPNKVYTMLVFGNFDANQDGIATAQETSDIKALIAEWGGKSVDDLAGNVDFLVLGQRPVVPPEPPSGAPNAIMEEHARVKALANKYDNFYKQAAATSIPILNENRLYTLIGRRLGR